MNKDKNTKERTKAGNAVIPEKIKVTTSKLDEVANNFIRINRSEAGRSSFMI